MIQHSKDHIEGFNNACTMKLFMSCQYDIKFYDAGECSVCVLCMLLDLDTRDNCTVLPLSY